MMIPVTRNAATGCGYSKKFALMCTGSCPPGHDRIAAIDLILNCKPEIGKGIAVASDELFQAIGTLKVADTRFMIDILGRNQLVDDAKVALVYGLFDGTADRCQVLC